jgi:hypothetical protein
MSSYEETKKVLRVYSLDGFNGTSPITTEIFSFEDGIFKYNEYVSEKMLERLRRRQITKEQFFAMIKGDNNA